MKLLNMKSVFAVLIGCLFLQWSCKPNATEQKKAEYNTIINLRYMEKDLKVHSEGRFAPKAGPFKASLPTSLSLNKSAMGAIESLQGHFLYDGASTAIGGEQVFEWISPQSKQPCKVTLAPVLMQSLQFSAQPLSHQSVARLQWQGAPLTPNDALVLLWENTETRATVTTQARSTAAETKVLELPAFEVKKVPVGSYQLTVIRKRLEESNQDGSDVKAQYEVYHKPIAVKVQR
jgi:hypothetical protein